jgi:hypothetical protein
MNKSVACAKIDNYKTLQCKLTFLAFTSPKVFTNSEKSRF